MRKKILSFALLLLVLTFLTLTSSATVDISLTPSTITLSKTINSTTFSVSNDGNEIVDISLDPSVSFTDDDGNIVTISLSPNSISNLAIGNSSEVTATASGDILELNLGEYEKTLAVNATSTSGNSSEEILTIIFKSSFCDYGAINDSDIKVDVDINNFDGDDEEWKPLDRIEVEVEVKNKKDYDLDDVVFELGLIEETSGDDVAGDLVWLSKDDEKVEVGDIDEDEEESHVFEFRVDAEMGIDEKNYLVMIKAYPDGQEDEICIDHSDDLSKDFYQDIEIDREDEDDRQVVVNDIVFPDSVNCGETVQVRAKAYNIGEKDQEQVMVELKCLELGIEKSYTIRKDLDMGESELISFSFTVPQDAEEKSYPLYFRAFYDYDEDDDEYDEYSEEFVEYLKVEGLCIGIKDVGISAILETPEEDVKAGKEVEIKATIENTGEEKTTYAIGVSDNELFSTTKSIEPTSITLEPGETADVLITLKLNKDVEGEQLFNIKALFDDQEIKQAVSLTITPRFGITGAAIRESFSENWFIWAIVIVNIILIIAIISVAVRMSRV